MPSAKVDLDKLMRHNGAKQDRIPLLDLVRQATKLGDECGWRIEALDGQRDPVAILRWLDGQYLWRLGVGAQIILRIASMRCAGGGVISGCNRSRRSEIHSFGHCRFFL